MSHKKDIDGYCKDIISGRILSCDLIKKAVKRFLTDIKETKNESCQWEYKQELVDEFLDFTEQLKIADINTDTKCLKLLPWQKWVYANLVGFVMKHDNTIRRFRKAFIMVARKNGKTTGFLFPLLLWDFFSEDAAESYLISGDNLQASKTFSELHYILKAEKAIADRINATAGVITLQNSRMAFFSSETSNLDSYKPSIALIDEYWNYSSNKPVTSMEYGMRHRKRGQVVIITSAGTNINGPAYEEYERAKKVLNKISTNDFYFTAVYQIDDNDDWKDPKNLIKANPSLGDILRKEILLKDLDDALQMPSLQPEYKSKTLGLFVSGTTNWIPLSTWEKNKIYKLPDLKGRDCVIAFDLSSIGDFSALTRYFRLDDGKLTALHTFYVPEDTVSERYQKENIGILSWIQQGLVKLTPGSTINYDYIYNDIKESVELYSVREIVYDKWHASVLIDKIEKEFYNIPIIRFDQSLQGMQQATKDFEKAVRDGEIVDNNPIMTWMMGNVIIKVDPNGNYKPLKEYKSSTKRIDGVISSIMAFSRLREQKIEGGMSVEEYLAVI